MRVLRGMPRSVLSLRRTPRRRKRAPVLLSQLSLDGHLTPNATDGMKPKTTEHVAARSTEARLIRQRPQLGGQGSPSEQGLPSSTGLLRTRCEAGFAYGDRNRRFRIAWHSHGDSAPEVERLHTLERAGTRRRNPPHSGTKHPDFLRDASGASLRVSSRVPTHPLDSRSPVSADALWLGRRSVDPIDRGGRSRHSGGVRRGLCYASSSSAARTC